MSNTPRPQRKVCTAKVSLQNRLAPSKKKDPFSRLIVHLAGGRDVAAFNVIWKKACKLKARGNLSRAQALLKKLRMTITAKDGGTVTFGLQLKAKGFQLIFEPGTTTPGSKVVVKKLIDRCYAMQTL